MVQYHIPFEIIMNSLELSPHHTRDDFPSMSVLLALQYLLTLNHIYKSTKAIPC